MKNQCTKGEYCDAVALPLDGVITAERPEEAKRAKLKEIMAQSIFGSSLNTFQDLIDSYESEIARFQLVRKLSAERAELLNTFVDLLGSTSDEKVFQACEKACGLL